MIWLRLICGEGDKNAKEKSDYSMPFAILPQRARKKKIPFLLLLCIFFCRWACKKKILEPIIYLELLTKHHRIFLRSYTRSSCQIFAATFLDRNFLWLSWTWEKIDSEISKFFKNFFSHLFLEWLLFFSIILIWMIKKKKRDC